MKKISHVVCIVVCSVFFFEGLCTASKHSWNVQHVQALANKKRKRFPKVKAKNLSKKTIYLPTQFPGKINVLLLGFKRNHQKDFKLWIPHIKRMCEKYSGLDYVQMPVMGGFAGMFRYFIENGMRKMFPKKRDRERFLPLYVSQNTIGKNFRWNTFDRMALVVVDQMGRELWEARGPYTSGKLQTLKQTVVYLHSPSSKREKS